MKTEITPEHQEFFDSLEIKVLKEFEDPAEDSYDTYLNIYWDSAEFDEFECEGEEMLSFPIKNGSLLTDDEKEEFLEENENNIKNLQNFMNAYDIYLNICPEKAEFSHNEKENCINFNFERGSSFVDTDDVDVIDAIIDDIDSDYYDAYYTKIDIKNDIKNLQKCMGDYDITKLQECIDMSDIYINTVEKCLKDDVEESDTSLDDDVCAIIGIRRNLKDLSGDRDETECNLCKILEDEIEILERDIQYKINEKYNENYEKYNENYKKYLYKVKISDIYPYAVKMSKEALKEMVESIQSDVPRMTINDMTDHIVGHVNTWFEIQKCLEEEKL